MCSMDSLQELFTARYEAAKRRELEAQRSSKKQKSETKLKELESSNNLKCMKNIFSFWKEIIIFPWKKYAKKIIDFMLFARSLRNSEINHTSFTETLSDQEIIANTVREYNESLKRDEAREMIPLIFWANTYCSKLPDDYILDKYVQRMITVRDFSNEMKDWPSLGTFLFWVRIHQNGNSKIPRWLGYVRKDLMLLAFGKIFEIGEEIVRYQKYQCPQCDGMFLYQDLVDHRDLKICYICKTMSETPDSYELCCICSNFAKVDEYEGLPICEGCAKEQGIFKSDDSSNCPSCGHNFFNREMISNEDGILLCRECNVYSVDDNSESE